MNNLGLWTYDKYTTLQEISVVLDENKELKSKVDDLTEENNQLRQDTDELSRLRELYQLDEKYTGYTKVGARIIEVTADNWSKAFKVDKGSDDGIKKDTNVCPSLHVIGSVAAMFGLWDCKALQSVGWKIAATSIAVCISLSTVFMKQHSIMDVLAALPVCFFGWWIAYKILPNNKTNRFLARM